MRVQKVWDFFQRPCTLQQPLEAQRSTHVALLSGSQLILLSADRGIVLWVLQLWRCWIKGYSTASQMHFKHLSDRFSARCTWSTSFVSGKRKPVCTRLYGSVSLWAGCYHQGIWTERNAYFFEREHLYLKIPWFRLMMEQTSEVFLLVCKALLVPWEFSLLNVIVLLRTGWWISVSFFFFFFFDAPHSSIKF